MRKWIKFKVLWEIWSSILGTFSILWDFILWECLYCSLKFQLIHELGHLTIAWLPFDGPSWMGWINQLLKHIYKTQVHFSDKPLPPENFTPFFQFDYTLRAGSSFFQKKTFPLALFNENMFVLTKQQEKKSCYTSH